MNTMTVTLPNSGSLDADGNYLPRWHRWVGAQVVAETGDGPRVGTLESAEGFYPVARFADGSYARLDSRIRVIEGA
jgi:hypothetical protein